MLLFCPPVLLRQCSIYNSSQVFPLLAEGFTFWVLFHLFSFSKLKSSELYYCNLFLYSKEELQDQTLFSCVSDSGHLGSDSQLCSSNAWCHLTCLSISDQLPLQKYVKVFFRSCIFHSLYNASDSLGLRDLWLGTSITLLTFHLAGSGGISLLLWLFSVRMIV